MKQISLTIFQNEELLPLLLTLAAVSVFIIVLFILLPIPWKKQKVIKRYPFENLPFYQKTRSRKVWTKKDWLFVTLITVNYAVISLWQLGSTKFPYTTWQPVQNNQSFILELTEETHFESIYLLYGEGNNNENPTHLQIGWDTLIISGSNDLNTWEEITTLDKGSIYQYKIIEADYDYRYIQVNSTNINNTLTEIAFKKYNDSTFLPISVHEDIESSYPATLVIDEQNLIPIDPTYMNESYFDEVYHPRNAWEIANGQFMYASVHPLLGTSLIALSIKLFGMNPFAWRLPGAITGILLLPLFYAILKRMFDKSIWCAFGTGLLSFDFMHLTTSRIATLEPFSVFWILLMFYFMIDYYYTSFYDVPLSYTLKLLFFSGISMGFGIATKWTACYSAVGLAILLFMNLGRRYYEYRKCKTLDYSKLSKPERNVVFRIQTSFQKNFWITIGLCFVFFIFLPILIYIFSYTWTHVWRDGFSIQNVWNQVMYMYRYHSNLTATHPYQSTWYQWVFNLRPIWYFGRMSNNQIYHSIACFTNPLLSIAGVFSILYTFYRAVKNRTSEAIIISIGYLTALLPWVLVVDRCVFSYHFYPTSFFMILSIVYAARDLTLLNKKYRRDVLIYFFACMLIFFIFLPVTAGHGTTLRYIKLLEWFETWYFG